MRKYLFVAVFISGLTSLAIEMAASRLLGNVFGTSNLVWASIIGLILIYLAAGYFLGGNWADRSHSERTFYQIIIWAAISTAFIPLISRPVLRVAADAFDQLQLGILFGSFASVLILLCVPMILMGTISPFAIRLAVQDTRGIGKISGKIYGVSTLGSFLGTFLPDLLLIPAIGTYNTFLVLSAILMVAGIIGLWKSSGWRAALPYALVLLLLPILAFFGSSSSYKNSAGQIYETESGYNYIQVLEVDQYRYLRLNEGQGVHSTYHPTQLNYYGPWEQVLVAPFFNPAPYSPESLTRIGIVGLAAGTTARQAALVYPDVVIDGYEIDPKIVAVGQEYFDMNQPNLNVFVQDGRWGLAHSPEKYQVISVDAYRPPYIPWHLTTQEFFSIVYDHLTDDGVMVINVGRGPEDRRLINALGTTIATIFPSIHVVDVPNSFNSILFATKQPTRSENLIENYRILSTNSAVHPLLLEPLQVSVSSLAAPPQNALVFTDDRAPVEWITNNMIVEFLLFGDMEMVQ